jgi:hypothetical protein
MVRCLNLRWGLCLFLGFTILLACSSCTKQNDLQKTAMLPAFQQIPDDLNLYMIDVELDFASLTYQGQEKFNFTNTENVPLEAVYFRLFPNGGKIFGAGKLEVTNLRANNKKVEVSLSLDDTVLEVRFSKPLKPGKQVQITMDFNGLVPVIPMSSEADISGIFGFNDNVLTMAGWYPILAIFDIEGWNLDRVTSFGDSVYSEAAYYDVTITAASDLKLATTGITTSQRLRDDQAETQVVTGPVRDFMIVASPDFEISNKIVAGVNINSYSLPNYSFAGTMALQDTTEALEIFNNKFGLYPYTELDIIQTPLPIYGGMEYPSLVLISQLSYETPLDMDLLIAHEIAHQWWYGVVGNDVIDDPWLDEAFAEYSAVIYYENQHGYSSYQEVLAFIEKDYQKLISEGKNFPLTESVIYFEDKGDLNSYNIFVYNKGALFLDALRRQVGDASFFKALNTYYLTYMFKTVRSQDLLDIFEITSGMQLDDFYQEWLFAK